MCSPHPSDDAGATEALADPNRRGVLVAGLLALPAVSVACSAPAARESPAPTVLAHTSDVPIGGGLIVPEHRIVVTQPTSGTFTAFSSVCPHDGCLVNLVVDGTIGCPCHGSRFAVADGAVVRGPALRALSPRSIAVDGDSIALG